MGGAGVIAQATHAREAPDARAYGHARTMITATRRCANCAWLLRRPKYGLWLRTGFATAGQASGKHTKAPGRLCAAA